jgi:hypothetical protein
MARRRWERAQRRILQRTVKNALALEAIAEEQEERPKFKRARHAEQLALLLHRGAIDARQREAGDRLARDFRIAGDVPHVVMRYEPSLGTPTKGSIAFRAEPGPAALDARRRFEKAVQAVGQWLSPIVIHVAVLDLPLAAWARPGMKNGDGAALLRLGLDLLADHYHLPEYEVSGAAQVAA